MYNLFKIKVYQQLGILMMGSVSKNADLRFMFYIKNNLWGGFAKRYNEI
jgi:hypothetical protein